MRNENTYQLPDSEMMKLFYEGKLSASETKAIQDSLMNDELMREAFANLNASDFNVVEKISASLNNRIAGLVDKPPFFQRWQIWLSIFIGIVSVSTFFALYDFDSHSTEKKVASTDKSKEKKLKSKDYEVVNRPKTVSVHSFYMTEEEVRTMHGETTMDFKSESGKSDELKNNESKTNNQKGNTTDDKSNVQEGPAENKTDHSNNQKTDNSNTIDPGNTPKKYKIRLSDANVLQAENLAEKEANSGDGREDMDVRNVNIGDPVSDKKKTNFNLEDMPQFRGGNEALASYVKGKIAIKSYTQEKKNLSTVVEFEVNPKGKIENITLQNALDPIMEKDIKEALASVSFTPGKKSGKKGSMFYRMALVFE